MAKTNPQFETVNFYTLPGLLKDTVINLKPVLPSDTIDDILKIVSEETKIAPHKIIGPLRSREICDAKQIFSALAKKHTRGTLTFIARYLNKDHTTVIANIKAFHKKHYTDKNFQELVRRIEMRII